MPELAEQLGNQLGPAGQVLIGQRLRQMRSQNEPPEDEDEDDDNSSITSRLSRLKTAAREKQGAKREAIEKLDDMAQAGTGQLLRLAWLNVIDTFGLTLIYVNIHVFLRWVLGKRFFCKLGDEWVPKQAKAIAGEAGKLAGRPIGIIEGMILIFVDFIVGAIILTILAFIIMILSWITEFDDARLLKKGWMILQGIYELGWDGVMALKNLF